MLFYNISYYIIGFRAQRDALLRLRQQGSEGGMIRWKPSSSSDFSILAFRVASLNEMRHEYLSSNSSQQYLNQQYPTPVLKACSWGSSPHADMGLIYTNDNVSIMFSSVINSSVCLDIYIYICIYRERER